MEAGGQNWGDIERGWVKGQGVGGQIEKTAGLLSVLGPERPENIEGRHEGLCAVRGSQSNQGPSPFFTILFLHFSLSFNFHDSVNISH